MRLAPRVDCSSEIAASSAVRELVGAEIHPGPEVGDVEALARHVEANPDNYWHPVGTCRMGPASEPTAVVGHDGQVHGVEGCYVADCSIMPTIPRATTAMPAVVIGERIARFLLGEK